MRRTDRAVDRVAPPLLSRLAMPRSLARALPAAVALALLAVGRPHTAAAQPQPRPAPVIPEAYRATIAASPFLPLAGIVSGEFEGALNVPGLSFGVGGILDLSGDRDLYNSLQAKLKYYPNEATLKGFAVGVTAGVLNARDEDVFVGGYCDAVRCYSATPTRRSDTKPTFGVVIDYNWLLGRQKRFLVGAGVGARRVLGRLEPDGPLERTWPDGRLAIGWAF